MHPTQQPGLQLSQNFLRSRSLVDRLLAASSIRRDELVLDLGAGDGIIAERLARRGCRVIAIEQDAALAEQLRRRFAGVPAVSVWQADILRAPLPDRPYEVFANLPFNATAAVITRLTGGSRSPEDAYLVVQRQAAERVIGEPRRTLFSLLLEPWFEPTIVHRFRHTDFEPAPGVEVVLLRLRKRGPPLIGPRRAQRFRDFVVHAFTTHDRTLDGALGPLLGQRRWRRVAARLGLDVATGPTALSFDQWLEVFAVFEAEATLPAREMVSGAERRLRRQQRRLRKLHRTRTPLRRRSGVNSWRPRRGSRITVCRPPPPPLAPSPLAAGRLPKGGARANHGRRSALAATPRQVDVAERLQHAETIRPDVVEEALPLLFEEYGPGAIMVVSRDPAATMASHAEIGVP
jgi:23S rRNA (adenine-N6)-dimethyltransferase